MAGILLLAWMSIYLVLPGMFANMAPVIFKRVKFVDYPVDFKMKFGGKPLFGSHKTFRGFFFGILSAVVVVAVQKFLYLDFAYFKGISFIDYSAHNFVLLGFLIGFGALFGDLVKSFFKRRLGITPGRRWFPWDQLDSLLGGLLFMSFIYVPPWQAMLFMLISVPILHIAINHVSHYLGIKETPW